MRRFLFRLSCLCAVASALAAPPPLLPIGSPAPDFALPGVDGKVVALRDFAAAQALVVIFTCAHCPTAQLYEDRIKQLVTDYATGGVAVVAISPNAQKGLRLDELSWTDLDDSFASMKIRARDHAFNFPFLYDGDTQAVARAYGALSTPHAFVFDAGKHLRYSGRIDDDERGRNIQKRYVRDAIGAILARREPTVAQTRPNGCSVKWAEKEEQVRAFNERLAAEPVSLDLADVATMQALRKNESGKVRLVKFWSTRCAPCIAEFPEFVTANRMYRGRDFEFVTVSMNQPDEREAVLGFLRKQQASNRNLLLDALEQDALIDAFDPEWQGELPFVVLLSPEGKVLYRHSGRSDMLEVRRAILKALNDQKPW